MNSEKMLNEQRVCYRISLYFTIMSTLFIALSPQFFGGLFAIVFIIPVYMGISGLKHKRKSGWLLSLGIVPIALAVSIIWIRYIFSIFGQLDKTISETANKIGSSPGIIKVLTLGSSFGSVILFIVSLVCFFHLIRYREIFLIKN